MKAPVAVCTGYKVMLGYAIHLGICCSAGARNVNNPHITARVFKKESSLDTEISFLHFTFGG